MSDAGKLEQTFCPACPVETICPTIGLSKPTPCPVGSFCPSPGQENATKCPRNEYQDLEGQPQCISCLLQGEAKQTFGLTGATSPDSCFECPPGGDCTMATVEENVRLEAARAKLLAAAGGGGGGGAANPGELCRVSP